MVRLVQVPAIAGRTARADPTPRARRDTPDARRTTAKLSAARDATRGRRCGDDQHAAEEGFRPAADRRPRAAFDDIDAAALRTGLLQVVVDRVQLIGRRRRAAPAAHRFDRDGVSRRRRRSIRGRMPHDRPVTEPTASFSRALRVPALRHRVRGSAAAAVLVQQPVRRVPDLPRLRQHHRARHGSRRARSVEVDQPGRDRAVEQAALSRAARRAEARGEEGGCGSTCRGPSSTDDEKRVRRSRATARLRRRARLLPLARAEEIQGARPRVPEPLSRLPHVPRLRRRAAAPRSARRARRRPRRSTRCRRSPCARRRSSSPTCS